jgi:hypothetical protein
MPDVARPPDEFGHAHDFPPPPFRREPRPQPDAHPANRPASFAHDWPEPAPPARDDGRMEVAIATRGDADDDFAGHRPWHMRRLYAHDERGADDRDGIKPFVTPPGKRRSYRVGVGHRSGLANFDTAAPAAGTEQFVPFVKAEEILGCGPSTGPAVQSESVHRVASTAADVPVPPFAHHDFGFEVAAAAAPAAMAFDPDGMSAPPVAFVQAPEPGAVGLTLLAAGATLLTRRRRRDCDRAGN